MNYFCTLFDINYSSRGLSLYESLNTHSSESFHLFILTMCDLSHKYIGLLNLPNTTIISLENFEDEKLKEAKKNRNKTEYCWTCTPSLIRFCIENFNLPSCTYLDADIFFFSDPLPLLKEIKDNSILITEHRYTPKYDQTKKSGKYCVQFLNFKNNKFGILTLNWWREKCLESCPSIPTNGIFGDQKYLDDWKTRFEGIHELEHLGGGVAPWNVQQYDIFEKENKVYGIEKKTGKEFQIIFYHFHGLKFFRDKEISFGPYQLTQEVKNLLYLPYIKALKESEKKIGLVAPHLDPNGTIQYKFSFKNLLSKLKWKIIEYH